jgi:hypothetical protein
MFYPFLNIVYNHVDVVIFFEVMSNMYYQQKLIHFYLKPVYKFLHYDNVTFYDISFQNKKQKKTVTQGMLDNLEPTNGKLGW